MSLKQLIIGSPLEGVARKIYHLLDAPPPPVDPLVLKNSAYDEQTFAVMGRCLSPDSNCVDVGCHYGFVLKEMLRLAPYGTHYAFEPIPERYQELLVSFPGVKIYDVALSDSAGEASFQHVLSAPQCSGLEKRQYPSANETIQEIKVQTERLDDIVSEPIKFIKIDVEGGELQVLKGAVDTIRKYKPVIVFEHGMGAADYYGTTPEQVYDLLSECGMCLSLMSAWLQDEAPLTREQFVARFYDGEFYFMAHSQSHAAANI